MALTNADFRRMVAESRDGGSRPFAPATLPDRFTPQGEAVSRPPMRRDGHDVRTIEIVWAPTPEPSRSRFLGGLAALAKVLALPVLVVGGLYAQPVYECQKQKSLGMLYYGTTVQMCVNERMAERAGSVQAFLERQIPGM
ncbi:hypothetical protein [Methylobacterium aquaticum]|uniref:hypothetical protein n=1 Tax=Methylobacterium aquaticum TaxID=270351 RepID=UPI0019337A84|nr:hypothetical protein [Methylobacterium aquaticum]QRE74736.1 hypothetical protein F1D61_15025 [Methylobacterium aquaticum]